MIYTIRHGWRELAELITSFTGTELLSASKSCRPSNVIIRQDDIIIKNITHFCDEEHKGVMVCVYLIFILPIAIIMSETGIFADIPVRTGSIYGEYSFFLYFFTPWILLILYLTRRFANLRYLVFRGDQVFLCTMRHGNWELDINDLRFHIIEGLVPGDRYYLEIEIPEFTYHDDYPADVLLPEINFPDYCRMMIIEVAARRETIDGMLAVLFPLLRGDRGPYDRAPKRSFVPVPASENPGFWKRVTNRESHLHVWFIHYKINQFLFWLCAKKWGTS